MRAERFLPVQMTLGESPVWDERQQALLWVDITGGAVWRHHFSTGETACQTYGENVGMVRLARDGSLVIALEKEVAIQRGEQWTTLVAGVEANLPLNRFNDGACDAQGRLWLGTMHREALPGQAALYRITADGRCERVTAGLSIANGLAFSPDDRYLYHVDTPARMLYRYGFDAASGTAFDRQPWIDAAGEEGSFDGIAVDAQGSIWAAHWGGFQVTRWDPVSRRKIGTVPVPVPNVTACCFAGEKLDRLIITTGMGRDRRAKREYPALGSLYAAPCDTVGLPPHRMAL